MKLRLAAVWIIVFMLFNCKTKQDIKELIQFNIKQNYLVISPNADGVQDELQIDGDLKIQNFVSYFRFEVLDESGIVIRFIGSAEPLEKVQKSLFLKKENINYPKSIKWDGKNNAGNIAADGKYNYRFIIMDNNKNVYQSDTVAPGTVYVDNKVPNAEISVTENLFSPNNDGNLDTTSVKLKVIFDNNELKYPEIKDKTWKVLVYNTLGDVVRQFDYNDKDGAESSIIWDGKSSTGAMVEDGKYQIKISAVDMGGNLFQTVIPDINVSTYDAPIEISVDEYLFSPNQDGNKDTITFKLVYQDQVNIVNWKFTVMDAEKNPLKVFEGQKDVKASIIWDGKDKDGNLMKEGVYTTLLEAGYVNGNISKSAPLSIKIDLTPPSSEIVIDPALFSPDGNGLRDFASIRQKTTNENSTWNGVILNNAKKPVKTFKWNQSAPPEIKWDGKDDAGKILADGDYFFQLSCTDQAGNPYKSEETKLTLFTAATPVTVTAQYPTFSPDKNKIMDEQVFQMKAAAQEGNPVTDWEASILDAADQIIFTEKLTGNLAETWNWNGMNNDNKPVSDGKYRLLLTVNFEYGTQTRVTSDPFLADLTPPKVKINWKPEIFSPDNDGENDTLSFEFTELNDESGIKNWKISIINPFTKKEFKAITGNGVPTTAITWDGLANNGKTLVESVQEYPVKVIVEDNVGNKGETDLAPIQIDILVIKLDDGRYKIRVSNIAFEAEKASMTNDPKNNDILAKLSKALKKFPDYKITIEGYANEYKKMSPKEIQEAEVLSKNRAITVAERLQKLGVKKDQMVTVGMGFKNPIIAFRTNPKMTLEELEEMRINRRVEFYLSK